MRPLHRIALIALALLFLLAAALGMAMVLSGMP